MPEGHHPTRSISQTLLEYVVAPCAVGSIFIVSIWPLSKIVAYLHRFSSIFGDFQPQFDPFGQFLGLILIILAPIFGSDLYQFTQQNLYPMIMSVDSCS